MAPGRPKMDARWPPEASRRGQNGGQMASQLANVLLTKVLNSFEDLPKNWGQEGPAGGHKDGSGSKIAPIFRIQLEGF